MSEIINRFYIFSKISEKLKNNIKIFHVFKDINGYNVLFVTTDDNVFAFGANTEGCCGLGHNREVETPQPIPELSNKAIEMFFIGGDFILALSSDKRLYGWGRNDHGQLGPNPESGSHVYYRPQQVDFKNDLVIQVSCGLHHALALTERGDLYGWGANEYGQVGSGTTPEIIRPVVLDKFNRYSVKLIYCSLNQSFAITTNGQVYSWGYNNWCQLGHNLKRFLRVLNPTEIINVSRVKQICAGTDTTYYLDTKGQTHFSGLQFIDQVNSRESYRKTPVPLVKNMVFETMLTLPYLKKQGESKYEPVTTALSSGKIYVLNGQLIEKTKFSSFFEFYTANHQVTFKTIQIVPGLIFNGNDLSNLQKFKLIEQDSIQFTESFVNYVEMCSGHFSKVYRVEHRFNRKLYAVKEIKLLDQKSDGKSILKISENLSKLNNEYVIQYFNSWIENNNCLYLQMELCSGSLTNVIQEKMLFFNRTASQTMDAIEYYISILIFKEVVQCVQYLHELKPRVVHANIKPANFLVVENPNKRFFRLSDIHLVSFNSHNQENNLNSYLPPELLINQDANVKLDIQVDIYSLGVLLKYIFGFDLTSIDQGDKFPSDLEQDGKSLIKLATSMTSLIIEERPSCDKILCQIDVITPMRNERINHANKHEIKFDQNSGLFQNYYSNKYEEITSMVNQCFTHLFNEIKQLGQGGFGTVYHMENKMDQRTFAIKRIEYQDEDQLADFMGEVNTMSKCSTDYVVQYFGSWTEQDKYLFIQMELCSDNLSNVLDNKPAYFRRHKTQRMDVIEYYISILIFRQIVECVHYLQESKPPIMHRDIKPENILVKDRPKNGRFLKLCDFGLAKIDESVCTTTHTMGQGTFPYMAPEMLSGRRSRAKYNRKVDIYSLGKILQDIFDSDFVARDEIFKDINSTNKSKKLKEMASTMVHGTYEKRPDCETILATIDDLLIDSEHLEQLLIDGSSRPINLDRNCCVFLDEFAEYHIVNGQAHFQNVNSKNKSCLIQ